MYEPTSFNAEPESGGRRWRIGNIHRRSRRHWNAPHIQSGQRCGASLADVSGKLFIIFQFLHETTTTGWRQQRFIRPRKHPYVSFPIKWCVRLNHSNNLDRSVSWVSWTQMMLPTCCMSLIGVMLMKSTGRWWLECSRLYYRGDWLALTLTNQPGLKKSKPTRVNLCTDDINLLRASLQGMLDSTESGEWWIRGILKKLWKYS